MRTKPAALTELPPSPQQEQRSRMLRYAITMGIRVVCLGLCLVTPGWWILVPAAGAVFLPYVAVVMANAVRPRAPGGTRPVLPRGDGPSQIGPR